MPVTLWRGDQLLGKLLERPASRDERVPRNARAQRLTAILIPSNEIPEYGDGVWQIHWPTGELGVQQIQIDPDVVAGGNDGAPQASSGALEPLSSDRVSKITRELQLTVRDEQGRVFLPWQITLERVRYGNEHSKVALSEAPPEAVVNGSIWHVSIAFASEVEAPAT